MADELTPEEQEEFEFRARAEHEARAGKAPAPEPAPDVTAGAVEPSMGEKIMGAAQIPFQYAIEHPAALAAGAGVYKAGTMANKYLEGQRIAAEGANKAAQTAANATMAESNAKQFTSLLNNYGKMTHDIRQYEKAGQAVPQALRDAHLRLGQQIEVAQSRLPGYNPNITSTSVPNTGAQTLESGVNNMVRSAGTAEQPGMLQRASQLYNRYAPALAQRVGQAAEAMAPVGRVLEPIAKLGGVGGQALFHSGGLNTNEDQILAQLRAASLQKNPSAVTSGFTQELQALEQNRKRK